MSIRESRIPHPAGARVIILHKWIANILGRNAAMIVGHLDYLDRARDSAGEPLASRAELLAAMEGFAGRDAVDAALKLLVDVGWLVLIERKQSAGCNLRTWHEYALDVAAIANHPQTRADSRSPEIRTPDVRKSGLKPGLKPGRGIQEEVNKEVDTDTEPGGWGGVGDQSQDQNPIPAQEGRGSCGSAALSFIKEAKVADSGNYRNAGNGQGSNKNRPERGEVVFSEDFLRFWAAYPSGKGGQLETWAAWQALAADPAAIMKGLQGWLRSENWQREAGRYVPNPVKFLREQRWQSPPASTLVVSDKERFRIQYEKYKGMTLGEIRAMQKREAAGVTA